MSGTVESKLVDYLRATYNCQNLVDLDPIQSAGLRADTRARTKTINVKCEFKGSASSFDEAVKNGYPIRMTVAEAIGQAKLKRLLPPASRGRDADQQVAPHMYDPKRALVNSISLGLPLNTMPQGVGIVSNGLPRAYAELRQKQTEELAKELGIKPNNVNVIAHIPSNTTAGAEPDKKPIPILKEVINGYHGKEVTKTFGGITTNHIWRGIHPIEPHVAQSLGLHAPPANHEAAEPPPGVEKAHNSWVIVPTDHILAHVANMPSNKIRELDYTLYQLTMPDNTKIPFLLMDLWTLHRYHRSTLASIVKVDGDRTSVEDIYIELVPLKTDTWLNSCMAGQHLQMGSVSFNLIIEYTMFPAGFRQDARLVAALSKDFPRMSMQMRARMDDDAPSMSMAPGNGGQHQQQANANKHRREEDAMEVDAE